MKKPASKKQALALAVLSTIGAIIWFVSLSRPGESDFFSVIAAVLFTINAVVWWRRWYALL